MTATEPKTSLEQLREWVRTHDISVMPMELMMCDLARMGIDVHLSPGIYAAWECKLHEFCFASWTVAEEGRLPSTAVRKAIRKAVKK